MIYKVRGTAADFRLSLLLAPMLHLLIRQIYSTVVCLDSGKLLALVTYTLLTVSLSSSDGLNSYAE